MWESRVLQRAFERLELHEGKLSRAVLRGGGGGDVTSLPDTWVGNHPGLPGPDYAQEFLEEARQIWRHWLSRRRRDGEIPWSDFLRLEQRYGLPRPRVVHSLLRSA